MGGDGGTLNNSRREHVRARAHIFGGEKSPVTSTIRASVVDCALSKQPLTPPVVVDRLGQLYNKEVLISYLLNRRSRTSVEADAFSHIRSLKRDTSEVNVGREGLMCAITRRAVTEGVGVFSVGWECGCVCKEVEEVGVDGGGCLACGRKGERMKLGMKVEEREAILSEFKKGRGKRRRAEKGGKGEVRIGKVRKVVRD